MYAVLIVKKYTFSMLRGKKGKCLISFGGNPRSWPPAPSCDTRLVWDPATDGRITLSLITSPSSPFRSFLFSFENALSLMKWGASEI
jgi:hypothetical protein